MTLTMPARRTLGLLSCIAVPVVMACSAVPCPAGRQTNAEVPDEQIVRFDFTRGAGDWLPLHDVRAMQPGSEGLRIEIGGADPYIAGPPRDYPVGKLLWLRLRLFSEAGGEGQVFYFQSSPSEPDSIRFPVAAGHWQDVQVPLPALGPAFRLRFDPPGDHGTAILRSLSVSVRNVLPAPEWPKPQAPDYRGGSAALRSGSLVLRQSLHQLGGFTVEFAGRPMAIGWNDSLIGIELGGRLKWIRMSSSNVSCRKSRGEIDVSASFLDTAGAHWQLRQAFRVAGRAGRIDVTTAVLVDQDRTVAFL
ncbi:MAG TPA: hypothetical protein VGS41_18135, partial [Chthonomonadales bacterium]|nr:hypothetical protein [Chthonomonadales bacterium]